MCSVCEPTAYACTLMYVYPCLGTDASQGEVWIFDKPSVNQANLPIIFSVVLRPSPVERRWGVRSAIPLPVTHIVKGLAVDINVISNSSREEEWGDRWAVLGILGHKLFHVSATLTASSIAIRD